MKKENKISITKFGGDNILIRICLFLVLISNINSHNLFAGSAIKCTAFYVDGSKTNTIGCLEMHGNVKKARDWEFGILRNLDSAKIEVYNEEGKLYQQLCSDVIGMFLFKLPLNSRYKVKVLKKGWVTKIIDVNTALNRNKFTRYHLCFEIDMFEDIKGLDVSVLRDPIARVIYNNDTGNFEYNYQYTDKVNADLKKLYIDYYTHHRNMSKNKKNTFIRYHERYTGFSHDSVTLSNIRNINSSIGIINRYEKTESDLVNKVMDYQTLPETGAAQLPSSEMHQAIYDEKESTTESPDIKIVYKIQIISLAGCLPQNAKFFEKCGKAEEYIIGEEYKYTLGEYSTFETALENLELIHNQGYQDAFLVAFINGKRITASEAKNRERKYLDK